MKIRIIQLLLMVLPLITFGQNISVQNFTHLISDMDARINHPKVDQNGDICSIIKVVTTEQGFTWEGDMFGIVDIEHKTAEYWLYIPHGAKSLTIKHPLLGILREYNYPEAIKEACVYEMKLTSAMVETVLLAPIIKTQWVIYNSSPSGAYVYVDDEYRGVTPLSLEQTLGKHSYRMVLQNYHVFAGLTELEELDGKIEINADLKANFGSVIINSIPEDNAEIFLDGINTGKFTPDTLKMVSSGRHVIGIRDNWYEPFYDTIDVLDNEQLILSTTLKPNFANVSIETIEDAEIFINGKKTSFSNWKGRLLGGIYTIKSSLSSYKDDSKKIMVIKNEEQHIKLTPSPITGTIKISTNPHNSEIYLNDKLVGLSPKVYRDQLIGKYDLVIKKEGFSAFKEQLKVFKDSLIEIDVKLVSGQSVFIDTKPGHAEVFVNGKSQGISPLNTSLSFGQNVVKIKKDGFDDFYEEINVDYDTKNFLFHLKSNDFAKYEDKFHSAKLQKNIWIGTGLIAASSSIYFYISANSNYDKYKNATNDATDLHKKVETQNMIWQVSAGVTVVSAAMAYLQYNKQKKSKRKMELSLNYLPQGGIIAAKYNF